MFLMLHLFTGIISGRDEGNKIEKKPVLELHAANNWVKYFDHMKNKQMKKLRDFRDPDYEVYITEKCNHYFFVRSLIFLFLIFFFTSFFFK